MPNLDVLFKPYRLNAWPNRIVMAPMTRPMSPGGVPTAEVAGYYSRRAEKGVGLIITKGTGVGHPAARPSGLSVTGERVSQPMSEADVANTIDAFARAARRSQCQAPSSLVSSERPDGSHMSAISPEGSLS